MGVDGKHTALAEEESLNPRWIVRSLRVVALLAVALPLSGCTAIGFGIGAGFDLSAKDKTRCVVAHVRPGTILTLHMRDGSRSHGTLRALIEPDSASYANRHREWADTTASPGLLPAPGERVTLIGRSLALTGTFLGLSPAGVRVRPDSAAAARTVRFRDFESLTALEGKSHASKYLEVMVQMGMVPTGTAVDLLLEVRSSSLTMFDLKGPSRQVAWDDVARVEAPTPSTGKWLGLVLGLTVDILSIVALASAHSATW
jgi:hypothetical protein